MKINRAAGQYIVAGLLLASFIFVIHRFILPVILGLLIALVFQPVYRILKARLGERPHLAAIVSTFLILVCVLFPLILLSSVGAKDVAQLANSMISVSKDARFNSSHMLEIPAINKIYESVNAIHPVSPQSFASFVEMALAKTEELSKVMITGLAASVPRIGVAVLLFLVTFYFGLVDGPKLVRFLRESLPFTERETEFLFKRTSQICNAVVIGALAAGLVQGTILGLGFWFLGIPKPFLAVVITVFAAFIPLMGAGPAGIGGTIFLLLKGDLISALVMFILFLIASVTDNVVKPWVLKGKTELHPLLGLLSVLGGMSAFGLAGIFLGPLVTALTISLIELRKKSGSSEETSGLSQKKNVKIVAPG